MKTVEARDLLTQAERNLLNNFRRMTEVDQDFVIRFAHHTAVENPRVTTAPRLRLVSGGA